MSLQVPIWGNTILREALFCSAFRCTNTFIRRCCPSFRGDGVMQNQSQTIYEIPAVVEDGEREGIAAEFMGVHLFMCVPD